jgi:hypothetical protein
MSTEKRISLAPAAGHPMIATTMLDARGAPLFSSHHHLHGRRFAFAGAHGPSDSKGDVR